MPTGTLPLGKLSQGQPLPLDAPWPGLLLRAAAPGRLVLESQWDGFSAGVFTYALTQSLWATDPDSDPNTLIRRTRQYLQRWVGTDQQPAVGDRLSARSGLGVYGLPTEAAIAAGVVLSNGGARPVDLWLGGLPPLVLRYLQPGSRLVALPANGPAIPLRLESRSGLRAQAKPINDSPPARLVRLPVYEQVRLLPQYIDLVVALDSQLKRVERVDATSALAGLSLVTAVTAGEKAADCLFGRLPIGPSPTLTAALPGVATAGPRPNSDGLAESSYGLFAPNRTLLPGTMLAKEEAVKTAVNRLDPYLQTLLALKLVRLTENRGSSQLAVAAVLASVQPKAAPLWVQTTERPVAPTWPLAIRQAQKAQTTPEQLQLPRDSRIGYQVANATSQDLHLLLISFDSRGECTALVTLPEPPLEEAPAPPQEATPLGAGQMLSLPIEGQSWAMPGSATWVEAHLVLSTRPFQRCLTVLGAAPTSLATGFRPIAQPLRLAQALLQDLDTFSDSQSQDVIALHHDRWATLSFRYAIT